MKARLAVLVALLVTLACALVQAQGNPRVTGTCIRANGAYTEIEAVHLRDGRVTGYVFTRQVTGREILWSIHEMGFSADGTCAYLSLVVVWDSDGLLLPGQNSGAKFVDGGEGEHALPDRVVGIVTLNLPYYWPIDLWAAYLDSRDNPTDWNIASGNLQVNSG